jgi:hypothetical protein
MRKLIVVAAVVLGAGGMAFAAPPAGGGRPDFAGRPDTAGSSSSHANTNSQTSTSTGGIGNGGGSSTAPRSSNAGGQALSHASPQAQPTLQVLDQAFSEQEISQIRDYFTQRAFEHKKTDGTTTAATTTTTTTFRKGEQLPASADAQPLAAELLAQLPSRPGLTYVQVGDSILLLAGPKDVIVDIIPNVSGG